MEYRQLNIFRVVARTLSFTRAAEELGYVQSNVTAQIKSLERDLGVPLFDRFGRKVVMTDAGRTLLPYADRLLNLSEEARETVKGNGKPGGSLTVGASPSLSAYRLPRLLRRFGRRFPDVKLAFRPTLHANLSQRVMDGSLDVAFLLERPVRLSSLQSKVLANERLLVIASPDHYLANRVEVSPHDLTEETIVYTEPGCNYRLTFERELAEAGIVPSSVMEFDGVEPVKQCVAAGMGIAMLPEITVSGELERGDLAVLKWLRSDLSIPVQMIWHSDRWISPALDALLRCSQELFSTERLIIESEV